MLAPLRAAWKRDGKIYDRYDQRRSALEPRGVAALRDAELAGRGRRPEFARELHVKKVTELEAKAVEGVTRPTTCTTALV
jgi:hypothetical protein